MNEKTDESPRIDAIPTPYDLIYLGVFPTIAMGARLSNSIAMAIYGNNTVYAIKRLVDWTKAYDFLIVSNNMT